MFDDAFCVIVYRNSCRENTEKAVEKTQKKKKKEKSWVEGLKAEFKKVIWPDRKKAVKQTIAVILASVFVGVFIAILDTVIQFGLGFIL